MTTADRTVVSVSQKPVLNLQASFHSEPLQMHLCLSLIFRCKGCRILLTWKAGYPEEAGSKWQDCRWQFRTAPWLCHTGRA